MVGGKDKSHKMKVDLLCDLSSYNFAVFAVNGFQNYKVYNTY